MEGDGQGFKILTWNINGLRSLVNFTEHLRDIQIIILFFKHHFLLKISKMFIFLQNIKFVFLCTIVLNISLIERILLLFHLTFKEL